MYSVLCTVLCAHLGQLQHGDAQAPHVALGAVPAPRPAPRPAPALDDLGRHPVGSPHPGVAPGLGTAQLGHRA